ncbi:L-ribulose-5-phosphate 3-epimerase [Anaerosinus massiliensis]|uniref:L-ribulose-5-phosphate 3-epimerase n=1 Tax=Massilibacillus massiliensis TaxID=1806837 RepID=UPI000B128755|nr:L-ribulose-5-phosphate 3-epimerase [Massilibacillus massiliensis]
MMKQYMLGLYEKAMPPNLSWKEKLQEAKKAGFDFLEMSIDETDEKLSRLEMPKSERRRICDSMDEIGIPIRSICLSGHRKYPLGSQDVKIRERSLEIMEKAIDLACDLGVRIIQLAGYDVYYEESSKETRLMFEQNLAKCACMAAKKGVLLGFETMETEFMNTVEKAIAYVGKINSPYLQIYPDAGNLTNAAVLYEKNVVADMKGGAGHIVACHLKETVPGKFREIPFGTGHVNFKTVIDTTWKLGVRIYVAEFWYTGSTSWQDDLKHANQFISVNFTDKNS